MTALPANRMATAWITAQTCAVCGRDWPNPFDPIPTIYTQQSIDADLPPDPICDFCVQEHDPELFAALLADRQRFWAS